MTKSSERSSILKKTETIVNAIESQNDKEYAKIYSLSMKKIQEKR